MYTSVNEGVLWHTSHYSFFNNDRNVLVNMSKCKASKAFRAHCTSQKVFSQCRKEMYIAFCFSTCNGKHCQYSKRKMLGSHSGVVSIRIEARLLGSSVGCKFGVAGQVLVKWMSNFAVLCALAHSNVGGCGVILPQKILFLREWMMRCYFKPENNTIVLSILVHNLYLFMHIVYKVAIKKTLKQDVCAFLQFCPNML